jgi:hypothetical protein
MIPVHRKTYSSHPLLEAPHEASVKTIIIHEEVGLLPIQKPYRKHFRHRSEYINPLHDNNLNFELTDNSILRTIEEADSIITKFRNHIYKRKSGLRYGREVTLEEDYEGNRNVRGLSLYKKDV